MFRRVAIPTSVRGGLQLIFQRALVCSTGVAGTACGRPSDLSFRAGSGSSSVVASSSHCYGSALQCASRYVSTTPSSPQEQEEGVEGATRAAAEAPKKRRGRRRSSRTLSDAATASESEAIPSVPLVMPPLTAPPTVMGGDAAKAERATSAEIIPPPAADPSVMAAMMTTAAAVSPEAPATKRRGRPRKVKDLAPQPEAVASQVTVTEADGAPTTEAVPLEEVSLDHLGTSGSIPNTPPDAEDEDSFFAAISESLDSSSSSRAFRETTLVYNALTGRMTNEASITMQCLRQVGFGINAQRQVCVENASELNNFAERLRAGAVSIPSKWPVTLTRTLGTLLQNSSIDNVADAVQQMIQIKINSMVRSRYASVVTASGDDPSKAEVSNGLNLLDEATDPTKAIELNEEQERVIDFALRGHHLYIGGSAGTGKTVLLRVLSRRLQAHRLRVAMTATTGVAGCHIGGSTFHHAMGVSSHGEFLRRTTILDYDVIIIDEVSMFPQRLFEEFDRVLREEAGTPDLPFGGVQIILCGDFLQLGCINEPSLLNSHLFHDNFVKLRLQTQVRQSAYPKFAEDLQLMRLGMVPGDLATTVQQLPPGTMVESAVNLLPTNKEVHAANEKELARLEGDPLTLTPETGITSLRCDATATLLLRTSPTFNETEFSTHVRSLLQATLDLPRASLLSLYRVYEDGHAMRVMLPPGESVAWREAMKERFLEVAGLINDLDLGATVTEIVPSGDGLHTPESEEYLQKLMSKHPIAQPLTFKKGCRVLLRANLSSNLVNGSIGTVVDFIECKPESFPDYLRNENVDSCIERYRVFCFTECGMPIPMIPVVKFHSGETVAVPPWEFMVGGGPNTQYYSLSSVALPLSLAYAFTVHKVQGLTLVGRVHLELSRMWPCEHLLYVAMSRVRNPEQLSMSSFTPSMVVANADCVSFDTRLPAANEVTSEVLARFPVSSWKRCNDTIYHLRRRGSSLRRLLEDATLRSNAAGSAGAGAASATGAGAAMAAAAAAMSTGTSASAVTMSDGIVIGGGRNGLSSSSPNGAHGTGAGGSSTVNSVNGGAPGLAANAAQVNHLAAIEHSVLVARRMRKLIKHVERVNRLSEARQKAKAIAAAKAAAAKASASASSGGGEAVAVAAADIELSMASSPAAAVVELEDGSEILLSDEDTL